MTKEEERYLDDKLDMIRASISGSLMGAYMFPVKDGMGERILRVTDAVMEEVAKDVKNIYKYAKRHV